MGVSPIPFTSIHEYYKIFGIEEHEEFPEFLYFIRVMDNTLLELESKKDKAKK